MFTRAASEGDLKPGEKIGLTLNGKPVLIANVGGDLYAIGGKCTHMGCMLKDGTIMGERIQCICHGSVFELKSGAVYNGPAAKPEPSYMIKVENGQVLVDV